MVSVEVPQQQPFRLTRMFDPPWLWAALSATLLLGILIGLVKAGTTLPADVALERGVQSVPWGPLSPFLGFVTWLSWLHQAAVAVALLALCIAVNRRAAPFAIFLAMSAPLYLAISDLVQRPRPSPHLVRVSEHLGGYSFPSGHANFFLVYTAMVLLVVGAKYLDRRELLLAALPGAVFLVAVCLARISVGGHWPSDVLGGLLLGTAWLSLGLSIRRLSHPVLAGLRPHRHPPAPPAAGTGRPGVQQHIEQIVFSSWYEDAERFGMVMRGIVWGLVGMVALLVAVGARGKTVDLQGSLALLESNGLRLPIGIAATAGLLAYASWGYVRAFLDPMRSGSGLNGLLSRMGYLNSAFGYTMLAVFAAQFALVGTAQESGLLPLGLERVLYQRLGAWLIIVVGVVVIGIGLSQFLDSWRVPYQRECVLLDRHRRLWMGWVLLGRLGMFARGVIFTLIGVYVIQAALLGEPHWAYSYTKAFAVLLGLPAGSVVLTAVSLGFIALGLHSIGAAPWLSMRATPEPARDLMVEVGR